MNKYQAVVKSCFSLAKYNNGYFKSEKQKAFLLSCGDHLFSVMNNQLGVEYNNKIIGQSEFNIYLDDLGIIKITKTNRSGTVVTFQRKTNDQIQTIENVKSQAEKLTFKRQRLDDRIIELNTINIGKILTSTTKNISNMNESELALFCDKIKVVLYSIEKHVKKLELKRDAIEKEEDILYSELRKLKKA